MTSFAFSGPDSPYTFRAGDAGDFSTLDDGTIVGILDITSTSAPLFDFSARSLTAGRGTGTNG